MKNKFKIGDVVYMDGICHVINNKKLLDWIYNYNKHFDHDKRIANIDDIKFTIKYHKNKIKSILKERAIKEKYYKREINYSSKEIKLLSKSLK